MAALSKKVYWKKRSTEKLLSAYNSSKPYLKEAKEFLYHSGLYTEKLIKLFNELELKYTEISREIRDT
jgi:hypothetical protein